MQASPSLSLPPSLARAQLPRLTRTPAPPPQMSPPPKAKKAAPKAKKAAASKKTPLSTSKAANSAAAAQPPASAAKAGGKGKAIEDMYQKKTQLEHILLRPDTVRLAPPHPQVCLFAAQTVTARPAALGPWSRVYPSHVLPPPAVLLIRPRRVCVHNSNRAQYIGSTESITERLWVYDAGVGMQQRDVDYVPGLYKIFDEILVNAADNKQRDSNMDTIKVVIGARTRTHDRSPLADQACPLSLAA
eukprot:SAG22_NODE_199_length_15450_cov_11.690704_6_plen_245_part_00